MPTLPMPTLYAIKNCDSCRKACKALDAQGLDYRLHDLRADGLPIDLAEQFLARAPREVLINRRSQTWRKLSDAQRQIALDENTDDESGVSALLSENPTLLKRPLLDTGEALIIGYREADYAALCR